MQNYTFWRIAPRLFFNTVFKQFKKGQEKGFFAHVAKYYYICNL